NAGIPTADEGELGQRPQVPDGEADLFTQLPPQRRLRSFVSVDRSAEQAPMSGIEDARLQVAQLQEVAAIVEHDDGAGGMPRPQLSLWTQEVAGRWSRHGEPGLQSSSTGGGICAFRDTDRCACSDRRFDGAQR